MSQNGSYTSYLLTLSILHLLTSANPSFTHTRTLPLSVLTSVISAYIASLGSKSVEHAIHNGRSLPSSRDVILALTEMRSERELEELLEFARKRKGEGKESGWAEARERTEDWGEGLQQSLGPTTAQVLAKEDRTRLRWEKVDELEYEQLLDKSFLFPLPINSASNTLGKRKRHASMDADELSINVESYINPFFPAWRDPNLRPPHIPSWFPPLPGQESNALFSAPTNDVSGNVVEDDLEDNAVEGPLSKVRNEVRFKKRLEGEDKGKEAPWWDKYTCDVPWEDGMLKEWHGEAGVPFNHVADDLNVTSLPSTPSPPLTTGSPPLPSQTGKRNDAEFVTSLPYFSETAHFLSHSNPDIRYGKTYNKANAKRRQWVYFSSTAEPAEDSLVHSIPPVKPRHARLGGGWVPFPPVGQREVLVKKGDENASKESEKKKKKDKEKEKDKDGKEIKDGKDGKIGAKPGVPSGYVATSLTSTEPFPVLHPFQSPLPSSISIPVPPSPMYPPTTRDNTLPSLISKMHYTDAPLLSRLLRTGPPASLDPRGGSKEYTLEPQLQPKEKEKDGLNGTEKEKDKEKPLDLYTLQPVERDVNPDAPRYLTWGFDWQPRDPGQALEETKAAGVAAGGGEKVKLDIPPLVKGKEKEKGEKEKRKTSKIVQAIDEGSSQMVTLKEDLVTTTVMELPMDIDMGS